MNGRVGRRVGNEDWKSSYTYYDMPLCLEHNVHFAPYDEHMRSWLWRLKEEFLGPGHTAAWSGWVRTPHSTRPRREAPPRSMVPRAVANAGGNALSGPLAFGDGRHPQSPLSADQRRPWCKRTFMRRTRPTATAQGASPAVPGRPGGPVRVRRHV